MRTKRQGLECGEKSASRSRRRTTTLATARHSDVETAGFLLRWKKRCSLHIFYVSSLNSVNVYLINKSPRSNKVEIQLILQASNFSQVIRAQNRYRMQLLGRQEALNQTYQKQNKGI